MQFLHKRSLLLLRLSMGICFLWFGILKLFNVSAVNFAIQKAFPAVGHFQLFTFLIAIVEIAIGASYLSNRMVKIFTMVMIISVIIVSVPVFITLGFSPRFPVLSLTGENVLKNLVIIAAGLVILAEKSEKPSTEV